MKRYIKSSSYQPSSDSDMIKEIRTMHIHYKGKDPNYSYRIAEIDWNDDIARGRGSDKVFDILEEDNEGIDVQRFEGYAIINVDDQDDYNEVKSLYLEAKKQAISNIKLHAF